MDTEPKKQEPEIVQPAPVVKPARNVPEIPPDKDAAAGGAAGLLAGAFSLLPLGVNRLLKLAFLTRAGPAPLRPGATPNLCVEGAEHVGQGTGE